MSQIVQNLTLQPLSVYVEDSNLGHFQAQCTLTFLTIFWMLGNFLEDTAK